MSDRTPDEERDRNIVENARRMAEEALQRVYGSIHESDAMKQIVRYVAEREAKWGPRTDALCDGDDSIERFFIEIYHETGLSFDRLDNMPEDELFAIADAAIRRRNKVRALDDPWVPIRRMSHFDVDKSTLHRHAKVGAQLRKVGRGQYEVKRSKLDEYLRPETLPDYRD